MWRHSTSTPAIKHGLKLYWSFDQGSWMRNAADRVPEEKLYTTEAWSLILTEILTSLKPYLDIETEVLIEEAVFTTTKESKETMQSYVTKKVNKKIDMISAFGQRKINCGHCNQQVTIPKELPDELWTYLLKRGANLTDEQRKVMHQWDPTSMDSQRLTELLLKLDRTETLVAQSIASKSYF